MKQEISSLMDGELEPQQAGRVIRACCADEETRDTWYLYHVIGDALRGQAPRTLQLPAQALERLGAQPTVLAPRKGMHSTAARVAMAAAASVATVGVVGWIGSQGSAGPSDGAVVAKSAPPAAIQPVASTTTLAPTAPALDVSEYLVAHRQVPTPEFYRTVNNRTAAPAR